MNRLPGHIFPVLALSAALAAVLGGCTRPTGAREEPKVPAMVLRPLPTDPAVTAQPLYRLQTWYLTQQVGQDDSLSDFWRFLDETALPPQERRDLARNGLRIAIGGDLAIERLNNALPKTKGMDVRALAPIYARQGYALEVPLGTPESDLPVLYSQSDGRLTGRDFAKATVFLRLAARAAPAASSTEVLVSERIVYGNPQPEFVRTPTGMILSQERPKFLFAELLRKVTLREGQIVVVGLEPTTPPNM
jgi:hypothetical protein